MNFMPFWTIAVIAFASLNHFAMIVRLKAVYKKVFTNTLADMSEHERQGDTDVICKLLPTYNRVESEY